MNITKLLLLVLFVFLGLVSQAQEKEAIESALKIPKNEVKVNAVLLIVGAVEVSYEYLLNKESALGISVALGYDDDYFLVDYQYYISPYYRMYFGKKYASGFFFEGFTMLNSINSEIDLFNTDDSNDYVTDLALGIGIGAKWVTKQGILIEVSNGFGRNLFNNNQTEFDFVTKFGVSIGYRF